MHSISNSKHEALNSKQALNYKNQTPNRRYDLEDRTFEFAVSCRKLVKILPKDTGNMEDGKQLVRSSGSVGANYIEANESLSKKDFIMRIKICKKESKESLWWLKLIDTNNPEIKQDIPGLIQEATELMKIFGAILENSQ